MAVTQRKKARKRRSRKTEEWLEEVDLVEPLSLEESLLMPEHEEEFGLEEPLAEEEGLEPLPEEWDEYWFEREEELPELPEDLAVTPEELAEEEEHAAVEDAMAAWARELRRRPLLDKEQEQQTGKADGEGYPRSSEPASPVCGEGVRHQVEEVEGKRDLR